MRKTITIGCLLILVVAACGTPAVDGPDAESAATSEVAPNETRASDATVATTSVDDAADSVTTTTAEPEATATTQAAVPATTRAPSEAAGTESSATLPQSGDDGTEVEGGGDDAVIGQVPTYLMDQVFAHAEGHTGVATSAMTVMRAESVTWPDGSLGCPEPGMQYTQALVPGYWVEIAVGDETLDYRLSEQGGMKLCETGGLIPSPRDDT
jgi:hypothetical protein